LASKVQETKRNAATRAAQDLASSSDGARDGFTRLRAARRAPEWTMPLVRCALVLIDACLIAACFMLAFNLREHKSLFAPDGFAWSREFAPYAAVLVFVVPIRLATFFYSQLYKLRGEFSYIEEGFKILKATLVGSLFIIAVTFLYRGGFAYRDFSYSRGVFILDFFLAFFAFLAFRLLVRFVQSLIRKRELNLIPTLIVGRGAEAELCIREMRARPELGYRVIGVIENGEFSAHTPQTFEGVPVIGGIRELADAIRESKACEVIIAEPSVSGNYLFDAMMRVGRRQSVEFRVVPSLFNTLPRKMEIDQIGALPMISLFREPLSQAARIVKRASDIVIASIALIAFAPLMFLIAVLIKLDSKGAIVFAQERVGMDGRIFLFYKFRSMRADADDRIHREAYLKNITGELRVENAGDAEPVFGKVPNDPRVTRIGRILRRTSLDELPQLWNVLRGDMSVVGPRPPIPYEVEAYDLWHRKRLDMKPGLTGLWQVSGRNRLTFEEMVRLDLFYIENWSLWLDLQIILKTIPVLLRGDTK
jgi:exopolysaccharide biosynthesis polyprenyl glycosylphosphotransferase